MQRGINVMYWLGIFIPDMLSEFSYSESDDGLGGCTVVSFTFSVRLENARTKYRKWSLKLLLTFDTLLEEKIITGLCSDLQSDRERFPLDPYT